MPNHDAILQSLINKAKKRASGEVNSTDCSRDLGNGLELRAEVSLCVFMYPSYPLQIKVTLYRHSEYLDDAYAVDRTKSSETFAKHDVERLLQAVRIKPCDRCSSPAFDPESVETNRDGLCERCFLADIRASFEAEKRAEDRRLADRDRQMKRQGMAIRITAWIHPDSGDDYQVDWYFQTAPTSSQIQSKLKRAGSCDLSSYRVITL